ncbi:sigma-70 family RNA polymerase sigma factor [Mesorhizobium sp. dw_380]|uniref:sigma-70 family RNA polymerase sigma factor n=1 Tax=Mesorhizobium sp. dw_380 TaxID=2812001 RepID=UPI001BDDFE37|nr:sigma-70 family RNA polymerase sigma factor [Mesorhizobium sp. dw_380]
MGHQARIQPTDAELAVAARAGDCACLGLLLERHRARLYAAALQILGYGPEAEDAVHDTFLIALRHIGELKDPQAVAGWLHMVLHRICLRQLRGRRREVLAAEVPDRPDEGTDIEERLEKVALREWVWDALRKLPEPLQATAMLRYFGSYPSYEELATILAVPIGTVRSRLSEAKRRLAEMLLDTAGLVDPDTKLRSSEHQRFYVEIFDGLNRHGDRDRFLGHFADDLHLVRGGGKPVFGRSFLAGEVDSDTEAGVRLEPLRVLGAGSVIVIEGRFVNPPEDPFHCPPGIALVVFQQDGKARRLHLHLSPRLPRPYDD